jgi:gluconate 2-dehydrogenase alpha chain
MPVLPRKDVVVIGYGAAAGPISYELAKAGRSVVALEAGPHLTTEDDFQRAQLDTLRWFTRDGMVDKKRMQLTARLTPGEEAKLWGPAYRSASLVGGSGIHWSGQSWRYYEEDFRLRSALQEMYGAKRLKYLEDEGADIQDWPLTYDDLEPFYDKVEYTMGIGGWPGNIQGRIRPVNPEEGNPYEAPRQRDFPYRTLRDNATDITFRKGALERGLKPFHVATAFTMDTWTSPLGITRPGCTYCSHCTAHGCWNGSKTNSHTAILPAALELPTFELRANSYAIRLNRKDGRIASVTYVDGRGVEWEQPGDIFYLGAYTYQNVRLLLHSGIDAGGQVGKGFMNRHNISVNAIYSDRHLNGYAGPGVQRQGVDDYNGENQMELKLRMREEEFFVRGAFIGSPCQRVPLESYNLVPPDVPKWGKAYKEYLSENLNRYMGLQLLMEPLPYEDSFLDLDPSHKDQYGVPMVRVTRAVKTNEKRMGHFVYDRAKEILEASGASKVWGSREAVGVPSMTHDLGGARMGADPATSATNRYGQVWTEPNVFVGGGALHPTMSGHNPTETIWAISYWMADAIAKGKVDLSDSKKFS